MNKISQKPLASLLKLNGQGAGIKILVNRESLGATSEMHPSQTSRLKVFSRLTLASPAKFTPKLGLFGKGWGPNISFN